MVSRITQIVLLVVCIAATAQASCSDYLTENACYGNNDCQWGFDSSACEDRVCDSYYSDCPTARCSLFTYGYVYLCYDPINPPSCGAYYVEGACSQIQGCTYYLADDSPTVKGANTFGACVVNGNPRPCYLNSEANCTDALCAWDSQTSFCDNAQHYASAHASIASSTSPPSSAYSGSGQVWVDSTPSVVVPSDDCGIYFTEAECNANVDCVFYPGADICSNVTEPEPACGLFMSNCPTSRCNEYVYDTLYICYDAAPDCFYFYLQGACEEQPACQFYVDQNFPGFGECVVQGSPTPCYLLNKNNCLASATCFYDDVADYCSDAPLATTATPSPATTALNSGFVSITTSAPDTTTNYNGPVATLTTSTATGATTPYQGPFVTLTTSTAAPTTTPSGGAYVTLTTSTATTTTQYSGPFVTLTTSAPDTTTAYSGPYVTLTTTAASGTTAPSASIIISGLSTTTVAVVGVCVVLFSIGVATAIVQFGKKKSIRISPASIVEFDKDPVFSYTAPQKNNRLNSWAIRTLELEA